MDFCIITVEEKTYTFASLELQLKVKEKLNSGWKLQGGVSVTVAKGDYSTRYTMAQAMIKPDDNDKSDFLKSQI